MIDLSLLGNIGIQNRSDETSFQRLVRVHGVHIQIRQEYFQWLALNREQNAPSIIFQNPIFFLRHIHIVERMDICRHLFHLT